MEGILNRQSFQSLSRKLKKSLKVSKITLVAMANLKDKNLQDK